MTLTFVVNQENNKINFKPEFAIGIELRNFGNFGTCWSLLRELRFFIDDTDFQVFMVGEICVSL